MLRGAAWRAQPALGRRLGLLLLQTLHQIRSRRNNRTGLRLPGERSGLADAAQWARRASDPGRGPRGAGRCGGGMGEPGTPNRRRDARTGGAGADGAGSHARASGRCWHLPARSFAEQAASAGRTDGMARRRSRRASSGAGAGAPTVRQRLPRPVAASGAEGAHAGRRRRKRPRRDGMFATCRRAGGAAADEWPPPPSGGRSG